MPLTASRQAFRGVIHHASDLLNFLDPIIFYNIYIVGLSLHGRQWVVKAFFGLLSKLACPPYALQSVRLLIQ